MNIYRSKKNQRLETGNKKADHRLMLPASRAEQIASIAERKVAQGYSADYQYAQLNAAREKRKRKKQNVQKQMLSGGWKQVPILVNMSRNGTGHIG